MHRALRSACAAGILAYEHKKKRFCIHSITILSLNADDNTGAPHDTAKDHQSTKQGATIPRPPSTLPRHAHALVSSTHPSAARLPSTHGLIYRRQAQDPVPTGPTSAARPPPNGFHDGCRAVVPLASGPRANATWAGVDAKESLVLNPASWA